MLDKIALRFVPSVFHRLSSAGKEHCADIICKSFEEVTYNRLRENGFRPGGIIDVGAFHGDWTRLSQAAFGPVPAVMVEAQPDKADRLAAVIRDHPQARAVMSPLSGTAGEDVVFHVMGTGSSMMPERSNAERTQLQLKTRTLDDVVDETLPRLDNLFLKIDVQGAELKVLAGGLETLKRCEVVQLECAMLPYNDGAPLMPEVVAFMDRHGFLPTEVSGFSRPGRALVQIDLLFARDGSTLRPDRFTF